MSAVGALARAATLERVEYCPHPERLESCAIKVPAAGGRSMVLCPLCKESLEELIAGYHTRTLKIPEISGRVQELGFSRRDAARFCLQLLADRARLGVGLLKESQL